MRFLPLLGLLFAGLTVLEAQPGPPVGAVAPVFQASDQNGQKRGLKDLMGPRGLMLVFFRSADW